MISCRVVGNSPENHVKAPNCKGLGWWALDGFGAYVSIRTNQP